MATVTSKYHADNILNWEKGVAMPAAPANLYLALLTAMPTTNAGTGMAEVAGNAYARVQITPAQWAAISTAVDNVTEQSATNASVAFPTPTGTGWGAVLGAALYDAATLGNWLRAFTIPTQTITAGATVNVPAGNVNRQVV